MRMVRVEDVEAPFSLEDDAREAHLRRFSTLFVDEGRARRGGLGQVAPAVNTHGEQLALKTLLPPAPGEDLETSRLRRAAFRREYECQRQLGALRGFPRVYAYGTVDGSPAIVMEWVEGVTLTETRRALAVDDAGRVSPLTVARLGRDLFELLSRLALMGEGLAHRDVSPANVMVRTARRSLDEQRADGAFDLCLVDFGSAEPIAAHAGSFTGAHATLRRATVDYAPPEMLSDDIAGFDRLRRSTAVDVYAAAGVLCELMGGRPPFPGVGRATSPYRHKTERTPERPVGTHEAADDLGAVLARETEVAALVAPPALERGLSPRDDALRRALTQVDERVADALMACLAVDQDLRPAPEAMRDELDALAERYADDVRHALAGEPLTPVPSEARVTRGRARRTARALAWAACLAAAASVAALSAWLTGTATDGSWAPAALLAAPAALAALARVVAGGAGARGLVGGGVTLLAAATACGGALWALVGDAPARRVLLAGLLVCASLTWLALVADYACARDAARAPRRHRQLP